jgi:hypothetical protein
MAEKANGDRGDGLSEEVALLVTGGSLWESIRAAAHESGGKRTYITAPDALELHVCVGLNACMGHGVGDSEKEHMAGTGQCATVQHVCHGDNECRGQGACGYLGKEYEQSIPGEQACSMNGSCASPINECRVASAGPFKGTGVWKLARKRFEQRMWQAGLAFGQPPREGCPDDSVPLYEDDRGKLQRSAEVESVVGATSPPLPEYRGGG